MDVDSPPPSTLPQELASEVSGTGAVAAGGAAAASSSSSRAIKIHPLAIIGISDHHTRVITGGSALPSNSRVVGLLFGYYSAASKNSICDKAGRGGRGVVTIVDAEEMVYPNTSISLASGDEEAQQQQRRAAILQKIELHQKVFPHHKVVGWYRAASASATAAGEQKLKDENAMDEEQQQQQQQQQGGGKMILPTEEDLIMTQSEMKWYCHHSSGSSISGSGGAGDNSPLFVLMDASKADEDCSSSSGGGTMPSGKSNTSALEELESGDELPLTVYETLTTSTDSFSSSSDSEVVFVNAEFELETYEPERIAVERVFKTQPPPVPSSTSSSTSSSSVVVGTLGGGSGDAASGINRKTGKKSKKETDMQKQQPQQQQQQQSSNKPAFTRGPTEIDSQLVSLQSSIRAMNLRVSVMLEYLQKVERREVPSDDTLLRSIDGIVRQLPLVLAALEEGATTTSSSSAGDGRTPLRELENEYSNAMLLSYLACTAKTAKAVHVYCEKFRVACGSGKSDPRRPPY